MATINLTGQDADFTTIRPKIIKMKQMMNDRKVIWDKLPHAKRKVWVTSGQDNIMTLAYQTYQFLCEFFDSEEKEHGETESISSSSSSSST